MGMRKEWPCWKITKCKSKNCCLSRQQDAHAKPCWEIAQELDDYRSALNVCKDCIVHLFKQEAPAFSERELEEILQKKVDCVLTGKCPQYADGKEPVK